MTRSNAQALSRQVGQAGPGLENTQLELMRAERKANNFWHKFRKNKAAVLGLIIVCLMVFLAVAAPLLCRYDPNAPDLKNKLLPIMSGDHWFGTDGFGRDLFARILYGARMSILIATGSTLIGCICGIALGLAAGYLGGVFDSVIMRVVDGMFAFPFILLSILLVTVLGNGVFNVILALGIGAIPQFARVVRGQVCMLKNQEFCNAERVLGASHFRLAFLHILRNAISPIIVYFTLNIASAIISEASLSFLNLGILKPTPSRGNILQEGKEFLNSAPHIVTISGLFILVAVIGFNLMGDGIRDVLDPKMKR